MVTTSWTQTAGMTSDTDTDNIEDYVEQAEASKDAAAASETAAADSASAASTSASSAATDAASALSSKNAAAVSETNAATSETNAAASAASASTSATSASTSASNSATNAASSASSAAAASTSETNSASSAAAALVSENAAAASETAASASASAASTSETNAAASETAAAASETAAAASETAAQTAQAAAEAAEAATEALFDQFGDQYLGPKASDPTVDNDGNPLAEGAIYFNTTEDVLKFYSGSAWVAPESIATTAANEAQASATAAAASEISAASSASSASTSETNAASSASAASTSETNAATSETNAASSASAAFTSETNAAASETASATSESNAASSASSASTSASNAATSESNAASSASAASISEANADTSEANALTYSSNAATSAAAAASSAAGIAGYDLDVIAETKGVTAVDVFVYDTSKDSDGGAWRKRTQGTSWYNETLNTAARGSRREFPAVAVIVAEADKVTIYDGDDPSLPMWMVFNKGGSSGSYTAIGNNTQGGDSLFALNAKIATGNPSSYSSTALHIIDFITDNSIHYVDSVTQYTGEFPYSLGKRNVSGEYNVIGLQAIRSALVNDVAMTVLPNAPIDAATGLPVPTIAVATNSGVSVIRDDGTVVDLTYTANVSNEAGGVWFPASGGIAWQSRSAAGGYVYTLVENEIPTADKSTASDALYANFGQENFVGNDLVTLGTSQPRDFVDGKIGSPNGLTHLDENRTLPANGMVAYQTSTYNTGWMNGDIKGAFLSDTDTADLVGSGELISNGGFDEDITGWTVEEGSVAEVVNGKLRVFRDQVSFVNSAPISTVVGETYVISADISNGIGRIGVTGSFDILTASGTATFVATSTSTIVQLRASADGNSADFDNISVKLADADRSVNNNGLVVSSKTYDPWHDDLNLAFDDESFTVDREASDFMSAITHDASSNATMTGSDGNIVWRPHNLLAYSEQFDNAAWSSTAGVTITEINDGEFQIDYTNADQEFVQNVFSSDNIQYTGEAEVRGTAGETIRMSAKTGGGTLVTLSGEWQGLGETTSRTGATRLSFDTFGGATARTIYVRYPHLYRSDLGGMAPVPADFQTAGSETYVRTAGREVTGTELVTNGTFDSDTSGWFIYGSTTATVSSGQVTISGDGGFDERIEQQFSTKIGTAYRVTGDYIGGTSNARITARDFGGSYTTRGTQFLNSVGEFDFTFVAQATTTLLQLFQDDPNAGSTIYDNISVKEIDVDPTTARYLPRLGHHVYNGSAWVNEGLLHESEARTNLGLGSNTPSDTTYWRTTATQNGITHTVIGTGVENGAAYLDVRYVGTATNTFHSQLYASTATRTAASTGQTYVASLTGRVIDGSNPAGTGIVTLINQEIAPSTFLSTTASSAAGSLSYIDESTDKTIFTRQTVSGSTNQVYGGCAFTFTNGETIDVTYRLKLFQFELGQMPSSYIPTSGATATRASESLTIPAANLPYSSTSMTIQMDGRMTYADEDAYNTVRPVRWSFDSSNVIEIKIDTVSGTGDPIFVQGASGVYDIVQNTSEYSPDILAPYSISSRHGSTFINGAVDGVALTANTTPTALPDLSSTDLQLGFTYNGTIRNFRMWGNDIKDDGIEIVTQPSIVPSLSLSFDGSEASHVEFDWSEK